MRVSRNGHHLTDERGAPWFWLGDTCWMLFMKPSLADAAQYLDNRRAKGFNVIQCVMAGFDEGRIEANPQGEKPWADDDPARPNEAYFAHVDTILQMAADRGLFLAMLPAWGSFVTGTGGEPGPIGEDNARACGRWIGERYKDAQNVFWVVGGDRNPTEDSHVQAFDELAAGLEEGDGGRHLKAFHPGIRSSSEWFHQREWLDFNMQQSGTKWDRDNYEWVLADYHRAPPKPVVDGEARYENSHMYYGKKPPVGPIVTAHQVRKAAYNAVLSGAMGHTYGCRDAWSFHVPGEQTRRDVRIHWEEALDLPGAFHMGHLKKLMLSRPWHELVPDRDGSIVTSGSVPGGTHVPAARSLGGDFLYAYVPEHQTVTVNMRAIDGRRVRASWHNPRTGETEGIGEFHDAGTMAFTTPTGDVDPDYVLVLEAAVEGGQHA